MVKLWARLIDVPSAVGIDRFPIQPPELSRLAGLIDCAAFHTTLSRLVWWVPGAVMILTA
jgi:hypothetical protein